MGGRRSDIPTIPEGSVAPDPAEPVSPRELAGAPASPGLAQRTSRAAMWMSAQSVALKLLTSVGQVLLSWLLLPEDAGLVALATTVMTFASLLQQGGVRQVLVKRQRRFDLWATPAFWMSLALGLAAGVLVVGAAPIAAHLYGEPRLKALMLVMALGLPLDALAVVPMGKLQVELRFRVVATLNFAVAVATLGLSILFAWMGLGAFAIVLPKIPVALVAAVVLWRLARARVRLRPMVRRWKHLFADSLYMLGTLAVYAGATQGVYALIGLLDDSRAEVGLYWQAYNLSVQAVVLVAYQLDPVLFAALSKIGDDPHRQVQGFMRSFRVLAAAVTPLCLLQAALSEPGVHLVLPARWHEAIPALQMLSLGMAFVGISFPSSSLLQAQGRFRTQFLVALGGACVYAAIMAIASRDGRAEAYALGASVYYAFVCVATLHAVLWIDRVPLWRSVGMILPPLGSSAVAVGVGYAMGRLITGTGPLFLLAKIVLVTGVSGLLYVPLAAWWQPRAFEDLRRFASPVLRRVGLARVAA